MNFISLRYKKTLPSKRHFQHVTYFEVLSVKYKIEIERKNETDKKTLDITEQLPQITAV